MTSVLVSHSVFFGPMVCRGCLHAAGRATTDQELEEMLESGNPAIFTQGVSSFTFSFALVRTEPWPCDICCLSANLHKLLQVFCLLR